MTVAYFSNQFSSRRGHGIARYAHQLFDALSELGTEMEVVPVAAWSDREAEDLESLRRRTGLRLLPWGRKLTPLAWTYLGVPTLDWWLRDLAPSVVHAVSLGYPVATRKPFVVTVHDIGPLTHPEYFSEAPPWIMKASLKQAVREAAAVICVSRATADELVDYVRKEHGVDLGSRIRVIHEGVGPEFFKEPDPRCLETVEGLPPGEVPIILSAGKISPRKNVERVIQALSLLKEDVPHHLVAVGGDGWDSEQVKEEAEKGGIGERVHFAGFVSDEQLRALYRRASVYVHASLFEGFGLTVLEAMASGCPVVTSNLSSLPEVAGGAAVLVNPHDTTSLAEGIEALCTDESFAERLRRDGLARAGSMTWKRCAERVLEVYQAVG